MAAELTASNAAYLRGRTGREPGAGDLYAAHFLGPAGAAKLMEAMQSRPGASAASLFPEAASANRSIFYRNGRHATVAEVLEGALNPTRTLPFEIRPVMAALAGTPFSIEMLMTIAAVGALFINATEEAAAVVFLSHRQGADKEIKLR